MKLSVCIYLMHRLGRKSKNSRDFLFSEKNLLHSIWWNLNLNFLFLWLVLLQCNISLGIRNNLLNFDISTTTAQTMVQIINLHKYFYIFFVCKFPEQGNFYDIAYKIKMPVNSIQLYVAHLKTTQIFYFTNKKVNSNVKKQFNFNT